MAEVGALSAPEVRARIGHPMIDGDGHLIEVREALVRFVHERGEERLLDDPSARGLLVPGLEHLRFPPTEERRRLYTHKANRWFTPARTRDYAAVTMPALMYERLEETGFDFAVVYPTYGIHIARIAGEGARRGLSRLYNEMVAEDYAPYSDRLAPVAVLPLSTPEEGVEELEHAVSLGLRFYAGDGLDFFDGTTVEGAARAVLSRADPSPPAGPQRDRGEPDVTDRVGLS
jgi:hypothetical protein